MMSDETTVIKSKDFSTPDRSQTRSLEKDNEIESAPHPMMTIKIPYNRPIKVGSLLRMKAE